MSTPKLSFIVVAYDMQREVPRTLESLMIPYQIGCSPEDFEIILIENNSKNVLDKKSIESQFPNVRYFLNKINPSSPSYAMNLGLQHAKGEAVAFCIDGARMMSPGIVKGILNAQCLFDDFVVATHAYHLGSEPQNVSVPSGRYNQIKEDELLASADWQSDGYKLFDISVLALSSRAGWFGAIAESNCIALSKKSAIELGGYSEEFVTLGGGYANLDFYARAQQLKNHQLVYLLGEGTFHQVHGGVATNRDDTPHDDYKNEYVKIRGAEFKTKPLPEDVFYLGVIHPSSKGVLIDSVKELKS